jgi:hypothetical protein
MCKAGQRMMMTRRTKMGPTMCSASQIMDVRDDAVDYEGLLVVVHQLWTKVK